MSAKFWLTQSSQADVLTRRAFEEILWEAGSSFWTLMTMKK
jgi:hypothetical protein